LPQSIPTIGKRTLFIIKSAEEPLFERVLQEVLPRLQERALARTRPLSPVLAGVSGHFCRIVAVDGSTLDALLRKVGLLRGQEVPVLAGRMGGLVDMVTRVPAAVWYEEDNQANDARFWDRIQASVEPGMLLVCDLGFRDYEQFTTLAKPGVGLLTRAVSNAVLTPIRTLTEAPTLRDQLVWLGQGKTRCPMPLRLVAWRHPQGNWYRAPPHDHRSNGIACCPCGRPLWRTLEAGGSVPCCQAEASTGLFLGRLGQWCASASLGDLAALRRAGRSD
jgi:hypothetical protein